MTGWQIAPEALEKTLRTTQDHVLAFQEALSRVETEVVEPVVSGAGSDGTVAVALVDFLEEQFSGRVTQIVQYCSRAVEFTADAANSYIAGDEQMAQDTMAVARESGGWDA